MSIKENEDPLDSATVRNALLDYLADCCPNASIACAGVASGCSIRPFRQGDFVCFRARDFAAGIGIGSTTRVSELYRLLEEMGVAIRRSTTVRVNGKRRVMKLAQANGQLVAEVAQHRREKRAVGPVAQARERLRLSIAS